ncbi:MAG: acyl-CoA dehydrogenase [Desulfuromonadales bacterium]|nr:acyl-CoA dehydrogenase [Desulfuromonadales bacterium]
MSYELGVEQKMLKESARDFFSKEMNSALIRELEEDEKGYSPKIWKKMAKIGWMGLNVPEEYDGAAATFADLAAILEEMGHAGYAGPFFSTVVLGSSLLLKGGSEAQKEALLPKLAQGNHLLTLAYAGQAEPIAAADLPLQATAKEDGYVLNGVSLFVPFAHVADTIICAARIGSSAEEVSLFLVPKGTAGVAVQELQTMAADKQCEVVFDQVRLSRENLLGTAGSGWPVLQAVLREAAVAKCAEMVGGARKVLKLTVDYAKKREQFGRPIGSFQAIQHHCADMLTYLDTSALITHATCVQLAAGIPCDKQVSMCKSWVSEANRRLVGLGHQVMGGFGFMEEADLQIYYRRAKAAEQAYGDVARHREIVAAELGL